MDKRQPTFLDKLNAGFSSPMFQFGANLLAGSAQGDVGRGVSSGAQAASRAQRQHQQLAEFEAEQKRFAAAEAEKAQKQKLFLETISAADPKTQPILKMMGPQKAGQFLLDQMQGPKQTSDIQEYELAKRQGYKGSFLDYQTALKGAGASRVTVNNAGETAYDKEIGKQLADEYRSAQTAGGKAARDLADLQVMEKSLENPAVYTGTAGETINSLKKAAGTLFGIDVEGVADAEVVQRISREIALGMKDKLPGPMSDSDRRFLLELPPGLGSSPEGARRLVQLGVAQQQWQLERSQAARDYAAQNGGRLDPGFYEKVADVDARWSRQMGGIIETLRKQPQEPVRSPISGIPNGAVEELKANPELAPKFDEVFGPGAARSVLDQ